MGYDYMIVHLPGEQNVWADLLSRWGMSESVICAIKLVQFRTPPPTWIRRFSGPARKSYCACSWQAVSSFRNMTKKVLG
jgi:hypothetical protein